MYSLGKIRRCALGMAMLAVVAMATSPLLAGVFTWTTFSSDANSGISASKTYTHAANIVGSALTINGVNFEAGTTNWALAGTGATYGGDSGPGNVSGTVGSLLREFHYAGSSPTLSLSGLTPGVTYTTTWYNKGWGDPGKRVVGIAASDGGSVSFDENYSNNNNGNLLRYTFVAPESGQMVYTFANGTDSFHHYGFSNEVTSAYTPPVGSLLFQDTFSGANTNDINTATAARQSGPLAPINYVQLPAGAHNDHQITDASARHPGESVLMLQNGSSVALDRNFNGLYSTGGVDVVFDVDPTSTPDATHWSAISLGAASNAGGGVNRGESHFGFLIRGNGQFQAFDGGAQVGMGGTSNPLTGAMHQVNVRVTDPTDGNPFNGIGQTTIDVYLDGIDVPIFSWTKAGGGYANNYINLQGLGGENDFQNLMVYGADLSLLNMWARTDGGTWNSTGNWTGNVIPDAPAALALLPSRIDPQTLTLDASVTLGGMQIEGGGGYTISSAGSETLTLDGGNGAATTIALQGGSHAITSPVVLATAAAVTGAGTMDISGDISGPGGLGVIGTNVVLSGDNTYSGGTSLNSGSLTLDSAGAVLDGTALTMRGGTLDLGGFDRSFNPVSMTAGTVTNNAMLTDATFAISHDTGMTFTGSINDGIGSLALSKAGSGMLELTGVNNFSGGTTINGGVVRINNVGSLGTGSVNVAAGGALMFWAPGAMTFTNNLTLNGPSGNASYPALCQDGGAGLVTLTGILTLNASEAGPSDIGRGGSSWNDMVVLGQVTGEGGFVKLGPQKLTLSYFANDYSGGTTINNGTLQFDSPGAIGGTGRNVTVNPAGVLTTPASYINWQTDLFNRVSTASTGTIALQADTGDDFDFSEETGANMATTLGAIGSVTYSGTITPHAATYRLGGGGGTITIDQANAITGDSDLMVGGGMGGAVVLTNSNDFTGMTTVFNSNLRLASVMGAAIGGDLTIHRSASTTLTTMPVDLLAANQLPSTAIVTMISESGGDVRFHTNGFSQTIGGLQSTITAGAAVVQPAADGVANTPAILTIGVAEGDSYTFNGHMRNVPNAANSAFSLVKEGPGTQILAGGNISYTGGTTVNGGTLELRDTNAFNSPVVNNGVLALNTSLGRDTWRFTQPISGTGSVNVIGTGDSPFLWIQGANSYEGGTNVSNTALYLGNVTALGSGPVNVENGASLMLWWNTGSDTLANDITLNGFGTLHGTETKTAIYADGGGGGYNPVKLSGTITLAADSDIGGHGTNALIVEGQITGPGGLTINNGLLGGTNVTLTNTANDYQGGTTLTAGLLLVSDDHQLGAAAGALTFNGGTLRTINAGLTSTRNVAVTSRNGTLDTNGLDSSFTGAVEGVGKLTKIGAGKLTLAGAVTHTAPLALNAGILELNNGTLGTLETRGGQVLTGSGAEVGTGTLRGGTLNTQGNELAVSQSLDVTGPAGSIKLEVTDGPAFGVKGADLRANVDQISLNGGTVKVTRQGTTAGINYVRITDDASSQISASKTYTHAIDPGTAGGGPATVNGVPFARGFTAVGSGLNAGSANIPSQHPGNNATGATGAISQVLTDMVYGNANTQVILTDLTPDAWYDVRLYQRQWDPSDRTQQFDYLLNGVVRDTATVNVDNAAASPPSPAEGPAWPANAAYAMSYVYQADATGRIQINITQKGGGTYHFYGLSNEVVVTDPTVNLPTTDVAVAATSTLDLNHAGPATLGNLSLSGGTLSLGTATSVDFNNVAATGTATIAVGTPLSLRSGGVDVASGATLTAGADIVDGPTPTALLKTGEGRLVLTGAGTYSGGTTVNGGTLEIAAADALPAGRGLTIGAGGTVVLGAGLSSAAQAQASSHSGSPAAVPEPGTLALLAAAAAAVLLAARRKLR